MTHEIKNHGWTGSFSPQTFKRILAEMPNRKEQLDLEGLCFTEVLVPHLSPANFIMPSCKQAQACDTLKDDLLLSTEVKESGT